MLFLCSHEVVHVDLLHAGVVYCYCYAVVWHGNSYLLFVVCKLALLFVIVL